MKRVIFVLVIVFLFASVFVSYGQEKNDYKKEWGRVDSLLGKGLPKSALEVVDKIYKVAKQENNSGQFVKTVIYKLKLQAEREEDEDVKAIDELRLEIGEIRMEKGSGFFVKPVLYSMLAELYRKYYEQNRYKLLSVTSIQLPVNNQILNENNDIKTWDARRLVKEIIDSYLLSLQDADLLKKTRIDFYDAILIKSDKTEDTSIKTKDQNSLRNYRPTLYDFLAHRAVDYFMNEETYLTAPAYKFELEERIYFSPTEEFIKYKIASADSFSLKLKAIQILQDLESFHMNDSKSEALVDLELKRLDFVRMNSITDNKDSLYIDALMQMKKKYDVKTQDINPIADIILKIAEYYAETDKERGGEIKYSGNEHKWDLSTAYRYCEEVIKKFPGTDADNNCRALEDKITETSLAVSNEEANLPDKAFRVLVSFRNVSGSKFQVLSSSNTCKVFFRIIRLDNEEDRKIQEKFGGKDIIENYLKLRTLKEWEQKLPDDGDFREHKAEIKMPDLSYGYYVLLAATNKDFNIKDETVAYSNFWITNISYISRNSDDGSVEFYVMNRDKGSPIKDINIQTYYRSYDYATRTNKAEAWKTFKTDKEGYFKISASEAGNTISGFRNLRGSLSAEFTKGDDKYVTSNYFMPFVINPPEKKTELKTYFFTDRSIYRPGQTIYFKGIMLKTDASIKTQETRQKNANGWEIAANEKTTVFLYDVNYKEVSKLTLTSDEYGSINGEFFAPAGKLNGQMQITNKTGSVSISIEEYKRPKFEVSFDTIRGTYKLGEKIAVKGYAKSYSGINIDNAKVKYRVVRKTRFPFFNDWWWNPYLPRSEEMEIKNGEVRMENGEFKLEFIALTDKKIQIQYKPVYNYTVYADVTDINGETHSANKSVSAGYTSLLLSIDISDKIDKTKKSDIKFKITNLNGQAVKVNDTIRIYKLKQPERIFRKRLWGKPDKFTMSKDEYYKLFPYDVYDDEDNITKYQVSSIKYQVSNAVRTIVCDMKDWENGHYKIELTATDKSGQKAVKESYFTLYSSKDKQMPVYEEDWFGIIKDKVEPGENAEIIIGSKDKYVSVLYEIESKNKIISKSMVNINDSKQNIEIPIKEEYRGNISVHLEFIKHNRSYKHDEIITVPYTNMMLDIRFETFRDKLLPGQDEEWKAVIKDKKGEKVAAEMVATMYDASLDAFKANKWGFNIYQSYYSALEWNTDNGFGANSGQGYTEISKFQDQECKFRTYDQLNWFGYNVSGFGFYGFHGGAKSLSAAPMMMKSMSDDNQGNNLTKLSSNEKSDVVGKTGKKEEDKFSMDSTSKPSTISTEIKMRKDFNETAFFYPSLHTNEKGEISFKFTMPDALTRWKLLGLAYTKDLKYGLTEKEIVTQKDLMITTNPPRFFREGDTMNFSFKVSNISDNDLQGKAEIEFFDATNPDKELNIKMVQSSNQQPETLNFKLNKGESKALFVYIVIPDRVSAITYRVKAIAGNFSDGEENTIPVMTNRMLVTETMPLSIRGKDTKVLRFDKLLNSGKSSTMKNFKLTLEFTSNPAWYAIQALPYLMENPYESSENLFERYYASSIASYIMNSNPKIKNVFDIWKNYQPEAFLSNLEKNQDLKSVILQETPWVMEATNEKERKQRLALLFDINRMTGELTSALAKLEKLQSGNGGWAWFEGMLESRYFTQNIVDGLGHLLRIKNYESGIRNNKNQLPTDDLGNMIRKAVYYLDDRMREDYEKIKKDFLKDFDKRHIDENEIQYLYARSYFNDDVKLKDNNKEAFDYFKKQAAKYWTGFNNYSEGMIALAMYRYGDKNTANNLVKSLKEKAIYSEELGMYWKNSEEGYFWYQAPVETQALLIEVFDEIAGDTKSVEDMKVWLLKQKQTQDWKTGKATSEACYALLLKGTDILASNKLVDVTLGKQKIEPMKLEDTKVEAGTGYFRTSWNEGDIKPDMGNIKVEKTDEGVAWGGLYWQYFENLDKITIHKSPLSIDKKLYIEKNSPTGPVILPVSEKLGIKVGDKIKVRIVISIDRDMEYIHLKDMRASGFEPVNVLSSYKYKGGIGYYESTLDASTNFFISYLRKGTYVFEYSLIASQTGVFSNGVTTIQCLYAPEFSSHSEGIRITINN